MKKISKKILSLVTAFAMIFTIFASPIGEIMGFMGDSVKASAVGYSADEAIAWAKSQVGKTLNGGQCVGLITAYYKYLGVSSVTGNGCDYATNSLPSGWTRSKGATPQKGDILVFTGGPEGYGHVAIYESNYSTYHQNYHGLYVENITSLYSTPGGQLTYWGIIRPDFTTAQDKAIAWAKSQVGKAIDYDGAYGAQCVDLIKAYYKYLGVSPVTGNGCDYATNSLPSGWTRTKGATPQKGDVLVFTGGSGGYGHVAIYESNYSTYHQNYHGQYVENITSYYATPGSTLTYWGVIRPNFSSITPTPTYSTIASATYFIKNTSTNTYLSVDSGTDANTQNISVASKSNTNAFKWKFTNTSGKAYKIRPLCSTSRLLNPYGSTVVSGNNVNLYNDCGDSNEGVTQWWYFEAVEGGYVIRNYSNSSCVLDISGTNVLVSTYVEGKQSQIWTLTPVDLVKPTITLDKSSYEVGDTVNISWAATPSSTNFSHYWLRVISPAGDNLVHKSMGNVNSYALTVTEEGTYTIIASTTPVGSPNGENSLVEGKTFEVGHEHTYTSKITKAATCTATGVRTYTCSKCGDSYTETIAKTGHNYSEVIVGGTFTQEGYSIYTCDDCGDTYTGGYFDKMTLPSIDSFALKSRNYNSITLSWTENVFATGYIIQQYKNNAWTNIANIKSNATTSYQITGLSANTSYKFRAVAYVTENGTTAYSSYTSALTVSTAPAMTQGFAITGRGSDFLTITWTKNAGASGYIIQEQVNGVWKNVASIKGNTTSSYKIANLQPNSFHRYRMVAYKTDANGTCYGKYTGSAPGYTAPAMVSGFKVSGIGADSLTVSWTKVASANGYVIDIYKDGKWSQLAKITSNATTSYKATGLNVGTTYKFRIKSYATNGTLTIYSTYSSAISGVPAISAPTNLTMTNRGTDFISVRWDKNADADGYMVYVYTNGSWLCVKTLTSNSAVSNRINGLESGTIYKIAVKSYKTVNGTRYVSGTTTISAVTL